MMSRTPSFVSASPGKLYEDQGRPRVPMSLRVGSWNDSGHPLSPLSPHHALTSDGKKLNASIHYCIFSQTSEWALGLSPSAGSDLGLSSAHGSVHQTVPCSVP